MFSRMHRETGKHFPETAYRRVTSPNIQLFKLEASSIHTHASASGNAHQHNGSMFDGFSLVPILEANPFQIDTTININKSNSQLLRGVALGYAVGSCNSGLNGLNPIARYYPSATTSGLSIPSMGKQMFIRNPYSRIPLASMLTSVPVHSTRKTGHWQYSAVNPTVIASQPIKPTAPNTPSPAMGDCHQPPKKGLKSRNARYHAPSITISSDLISPHCHEKALPHIPAAVELPSTPKADPAMGSQIQRKRKLSIADHSDTHPKRIAASSSSLSEPTSFQNTVGALAATSSPEGQHSIDNLSLERSTWASETQTMRKDLHSPKPRPNRLLGGTRATVPLDGREDSCPSVLRRLKSGASRIQKAVSAEGKRGARIGLRVGAIGGRALNSGFRLSAVSVRCLVDSFTERLSDYIVRTGAAACLSWGNTQLWQTGATGMGVAVLTGRESNANYTIYL